LELRQLETFARVAQLQSFTRAAEELALTQPAVTRQIAALERELHTRLLERMGRRVQVTAAGEALYAYAVQMLRLEQEAERAVADVVLGMAGRLAVGASSTTATYLLPPLLRRFREAYPGVELSVHTGVSAQVAERVLANEVDVGVVTGLREPSGLVEIPLAEFATGVVVYPEHPLAGRARSSGAAESGVGAAELAGSPLILMEEGTNLRTYVDRLLSAAGVEERVTMELDNVEAIKKMIEARLGISLLPLLSVGAEVEAGRLVALPLADVPGAHRRIVAIHRPDKYLSAALSAFLALLKSELPLSRSLGEGDGG
jgi:DNA-binding transcriptional LysR family regulator